MDDEVPIRGRGRLLRTRPLAYASALGDNGVALYRSKRAEIAAGLGPEPPTPQPPDSPPWHTDHAGWRGWAEGRHARSTLEWNARRLAVLDRDVAAIIATHARDRKVAAWLTETAVALAEIGQIDLALDWVKQGADFDSGHQAQQAGEYWCRLLAEHRPTEELAARWEVFTRWPSADTAARLYTCAGDGWPGYRDEILERLSSSPRQAVLFALQTLRDGESAWRLAHSLELRDADTWSRLVTVYEKIDPLAVLPALTDLVVGELTEAGAQHCQIAARRLKKMRTLAVGTDQQAEVDRSVLELRETHRRRPRLQREFDRADFRHERRPLWVWTAAVLEGAVCVLRVCTCSTDRSDHRGRAQRQRHWVTRLDCSRGTPFCGRRCSGQASRPPSLSVARTCRLLLSRTHPNPSHLPTGHRHDRPDRR